MAVRDDREEPGAWILARVIKYVPEIHQYELKDDDDKEGIGILTAPRSLVIRLEDSTKGVQKGERVLAVFPDTTSFYLGTIHRVRIPYTCIRTYVCCGNEEGFCFVCSNNYYSVL